MGQAKKRGTFEQRVQMAIERDCISRKQFISGVDKQAMQLASAIEEKPRQKNILSGPILVDLIASLLYNR